MQEETSIFKMQQILVDDAAVLIDGYYNSSMIYEQCKGWFRTYSYGRLLLAVN